MSRKISHKQYSGKHKETPWPPKTEKARKNFEEFNLSASQKAKLKEARKR